MDPRERLRAAAARAGRLLWKHLTVVMMVLAGIALSQIDPSYNQIVGAYGIVGLLGLNLKVWRGDASAFDARLPVSLLAAGLWMWWHGNADVIPYLGTILFGLTAAVCLLHLALGRPLTFREDDRAAENYLDTSLRAALAVASVAMSLAWIPEPRYLAVPFTLLIAFRLALPVRRFLYPRALSAFGLQPTSGRARGPATYPRGSVRTRLGFVAVSAVVAMFAAPRLVFTSARFEVSHPKLFGLPGELLEERRAELEPYVATPEGSQDAAALTELGLVLHDLGLHERAQLARARSVLARALALEPRNAQAVAWYGASLTAESIYDHPPLKRMGFIADGLKELDRAVGLAPDDPIARLARLNVCLGLPPFARRQGTVREDVLHLVELARTRPREVDPILPLVYQRAGDAFERLGEPEQARRYWQAALAELPDASPVYRDVSAQIAALGPPHDPAAARSSAGEGIPEPTGPGRALRAEVAR
jgi:tetratricopeptide (TPR) repeat protein